MIIFMKNDGDNFVTNHLGAGKFVLKYTKDGCSFESELL